MMKEILIIYSCKCHKGQIYQAHHIEDGFIEIDKDVGGGDKLKWGRIGKGTVVNIGKLTGTLKELKDIHTLLKALTR